MASGLTLHELLTKSRGAATGGPAASAYAVNGAKTWVWDVEPTGGSSNGTGHWTFGAASGPQQTGLGAAPANDATAQLFVMPPWNVQKHSGDPDRRAMALIQYLLERYFRAFRADEATLAASGNLVRKDVIYGATDENVLIRYTVEFNMPGVRLSQTMTNNIGDDFVESATEY